jgi:hypothetical protein
MKNEKKKQIKTRKFNIYRRLSVLGGMICSGILASPMCCIIQQRQQKTKKKQNKETQKGFIRMLALFFIVCND